MDPTVVVAAMGLVSTLAAAFGTRWFDYRHHDRTWQRDQRLEAHHAFLNQINRLVHVLQEVAGANHAKRDALMPDVAEALTKTVDAFNRVELVCTQATYDLAVKVLVAARADQVLDPAQFPTLMQAIGEASRNYREAAKAELRG